jgi:hypothetical protein
LLAKEASERFFLGLGFDPFRRAAANISAGRACAGTSWAFLFAGRGWATRTGMVLSKRVVVCITHFTRLPAFNFSTANPGLSVFFK